MLFKKVSERKSMVMKLLFRYINKNNYVLTTDPHLLVAVKI
jgi:hypothetical protein